MDTWQEEWAPVSELSDFESFYNALPSDINTENEEHVHSSNLSRNEEENNEEEKSEKTDSRVISASLAKRRLQAYSNKLHLKKALIKDEKIEEEKQDLKSPRKTKKALYPDERAKAVINEIEKIKQQEAEEEWKHKEKTRELVAAAIKSITNMNKTRSRSSSSEKESHFKKRNISSRNYRRTDSYGGKSTSPDRKSRKNSRQSYPKNWTEYREQRLTTVKDGELKKKLLNWSAPNKSDLCLQLYNFNTPCHLLEPFTYATQDGSSKEVSFPLLRVTKTKPQIIFSINPGNNPNGFVNRMQLYPMISSERIHVIEKLINTPSKLNLNYKEIETRHWYHKSWKKAGDAECKILENSVGLSFLQNYSDEEEENDEEQIVICSSAKTSKKISETRTKNNGQEKIDNTINESVKNKQTEKQYDELFEEKKNVLGMEDTLISKSPEMNKENWDETVRTPKRQDNEPNEIIEEAIIKSGEYTPEQKQQIETSKGDINATKRAIKKLQAELEKRSMIISEKARNSKMEKEKNKEENNDKKEKKKRKKKKIKKKIEDSCSEHEEMTSKIKKRPKNKSKKKYYSSSEEEVIEDEEKGKKKNKKKTKSKVDKKKLKNKLELEKSSKLKKRDDTSDEEITKLDKKKKNKKDKSKIEEESDISTESISKKKRKRRKSKKIKQSNFSDDEEQKDPDINKYSKKKKKTPRKKVESDVTSVEAKYEGLKSKIVELGNQDSSRSDKSHKSRKRKNSLEDDMKVKLKEKKSKNSVESSEKQCKVPSEVTIKKEFSKNENKERKTKSSDKFDICQEKRDSDKYITYIDNNMEECPVIDNEKENKIIKKQTTQEKQNSFTEDEFPIEKDTYEIISQEKEQRTPATEEYRENWEKDPLWETEEDLQQMKAKLANSSWESDEEVVEQVVREPEKPRSYSENFDLEIPLNIKPFKRREHIDTDIELQFLKFESKCLSEERRQLEIEKMKVRELELQVMQEVDVKSEIDYGYKENKVTDGITDKPKRYRWDKKVAEPTMSTSQNIDPAITKSKKNRTSESDTSIVLENEYEEFMKALTSKTDSKHLQEKNVTCNVDLTKCEYKDTEHVTNKLSIYESPLDSSQHPLIIPKDVSNIPMPNEVKPEIKFEIETSHTSQEMKPVPVPSPKIDIEVIPKSLINLSLSANITLDIASKVDSPNHSSLNIIKPPLYFNLPNISKNEDVVSSSGIETINYNFKDNVDILATELSPEVQNEHLYTNQNNSNISSSTTDIILTSSLKNSKQSDATQATNLELGIKPFSFSGMILPTKKVLLDNSNLNLNDSGDESSSVKDTNFETEYSKKENSVIGNEMPIPSQENMTLIKSEKDLKQKPVQNEPDQTNTFMERDRRRFRPNIPPIKFSNSRISSRRESPRKSRREPSPRRRWNESPRVDRRTSPKRFSSPGRRRSPHRRKLSPAKRRQSSRRSRSPIHRKRSISPRRKLSSSPRRKLSSSPRRKSSISPRRKSPRNSPPRSFSRPHSKSPEKLKSFANRVYSSPEKTIVEHRKRKSPITVTSPLERLKRSVADSTISDDLLPQPNSNLEEFSDSPLPQFYKNIVSSANISLDPGINQILNYNRNTKQIDTSYKEYYDQFSRIQQYGSPSSSCLTKPNIERAIPVQSYSNNDIVNSQSSFVQIGNMVQIVPREIPIKTEILPHEPEDSQKGHEEKSILLHETEDLPVTHEEKSQIVQVGNMLQIVPTDFSQNKMQADCQPKEEPTEVEKENEPIVQEKIEKQSAEEIMKTKIAERRAERDKRRLEKELKRKEKDKRREEKDKQRQIKMKQKTENMIKQALQLEVEGIGEEEGTSALSETPTQWPPIPVLSGVSKDHSRSILVRGGIVKRDKSSWENRKAVHFADGVRPGEGTSPSGGEELSSPPTPKAVLPKEKRYTKTKFHNKAQKKKVKVKVIKKPPEPESDEDDNLPPPSPPPGSPPPHIFPPRVKIPMINNIHPYVKNIAGVQILPPVQSQTQNQQFLRQQSVNLIMVPPPPPPHHLPPHHLPPHPPHHHGPPPPHHHPPPPPHHHGPNPPHHHGPPPPHHHGPAPPHHHGPAPPHHHGPAPPHHHGPAPPHHHHPPPPGPPYHRPPFHH